MLRTIFEKLDRWISDQNAEARTEGFIALKACSFRVVGQSALLEAKLNIEIAATADVDAYSNAESVVIAKLSELLLQKGLEYDQLSNEIWMPTETKYSDIFRGLWVEALLAQPEFVMLSKAKMALQKNKSLLGEYLALGPPKSFFSLCQKYGVNLEDVLKD